MMSEHILNPKDPFTLILAPDHRFGLTNSQDDIAWEIQLDGGEIGGLSLYSTLALSASSLRILPVFSNKTETRSKLTQFSSPVLIIKKTPNYAKFQMEPFDGIFSFYDLWIKNSNLVLGRITINNSSTKHFSGAIAWAIHYSPISGGSNISFSTDFKTPLLYGKIQNNHMVFLSNGAPVSGKTGQISLENDFSIPPGAQQSFQWIFSLNNDLEKAVEVANNGINTTWDAEIARIEVINQKDIYEVDSGDRNWDILLKMSQVSAQQLIVNYGDNLNSHVLLKTRNPEQKITISNDLVGIESFHDQQNPLDLWHFLQILPDAGKYVFEKIKTILEKFVDIFPDTNPKIKFSIKKQIPFPMVAEIIWDLSQNEVSRDEIKEVYPNLISYLYAWQSNITENNPENLPTWSNPIQSLYDFLPIHDRWHKDSEGLETKWVKSPMLLSFLLNEFSKSIQIAHLLGQERDLMWLENQKFHLQKSINSCWDVRKQSYSYQDIQSNTMYKGSPVISIEGPGKFPLDKNLRQKQRLTFKIISQQEHTRQIKIILQGESNKIKVIEEINPRDIQWYRNIGNYTSKFIYNQLKTLEVINCLPTDRVVISTSDFSKKDLSLFLPIWAQVCEPKRVEKILENVLKPDYLQPFGLSIVPISQQPKETDLYNTVDLTMNCLIANGLLQYGYEKEVKQIWTNNMLAITKNLKLFRRFMKQYDASDGYGTGDYNIINGLPSITMFLNLVGIEKWSHTEIVINRLSIFESPIRIRYRGNIIKTTPNGHEFFSPGGGKITTIGNGPHRINIPV